MAVITLKCSSTPWARSLAKGVIDGSYQFGFTPDNFLQLTFPTTPDFPADSSHFAFALYILSATGGRDRVSTETPETKQKDAGATQVTMITGVLLPLLFAREGRRLTQLSLPLFPRSEAQLAEALALPPLVMEHSFYMSISALPGLFSRIVSVPLFRQPNTLAWSALDSGDPL